METIAKILGRTVAIGIFVGWMSLVGSPHVVETSIGLVIAIAVGVWSLDLFKTIGQEDINRSRSVRGLKPIRPFI